MLIELNDADVGAPDDQQRRSADKFKRTTERPPCDTTSPTIRQLCGGDQRCRGSGAGAEQPQGKAPRNRVVVKTAHDINKPAVRQEVNTIARSSLLIGGQEIDDKVASPDVNARCN